MEEAVGADLLSLAHLRLLLAAVGDVALELLKRRHLGKRVRIRVGPGDVDEADAVIEQEGRVAKTGWLGALELVVDGPNELEVLLGAVGLHLASGNHLVHLRVSFHGCVGNAVPRAFAPRADSAPGTEPLSAAGFDRLP